MLEDMDKVDLDMRAGQAYLDSKELVSYWALGKGYRDWLKG